MRKIKWSYFQNVSQINEAKTLINNVFSLCNYAAVITLGPISIQAWLKNRVLCEIGSFSQGGMDQTVKTRSKHSKRTFSNTFTWQQRSLTIWLSAQLQNITTPEPENIFVNIDPGPRQRSLYKTNTFWAGGGKPIDIVMFTSPGRSVIQFTAF